MNSFPLPYKITYPIKLIDTDHVIYDAVRDHTQKLRRIDRQDMGAVREVVDVICPPRK